MPERHAAAGEGPGGSPIQVAARVLEALPNALYRLELQAEQRPRVTAHVGPEAALLRLRPGDEVLVELSAYDPGRGRIVARRP